MAVDELLGQLMSGKDLDPFPAYAELRETGCGVHWCHPMNAWMAFRHADVVRVTRDHTVFSNEMFRDTPSGVHDPKDPEHVRFVDVSSRQLIFRDPPEHTRLRDALRHAFTPRRVEAMRPVVERAVEEILGRFRPGQPVEFMREIADEVPVAVIAAILGVPEHDRGRFRQWSTALVRTFDPTTEWETRAAAIHTANELIDYLDGAVARRRAEPADDLITAVALAEDENGRPLGDADLLAQLTILLVAGNDTTVNLLGNGLSLLFANPGVRVEVANVPQRLPAAVEEMLRMDPPLHINGRVTTADTRLGGADIPEGTMVLLGNAAANRDPRAFDSPDAFSLDRTPNPHTSFHHGIHFCVGAPLARMEGEVLFRHLLDSFPGITAGAEPPTPKPNALARGRATLPVVM